MKGFIGLLLPSLIVSTSLLADRQREAVIEATQYLKTEALSWRTENACFSCHNNGDAMRALFECSTSPLPFRTSQWKESLLWLEAPRKWKEANSTEVKLSPALAIIQFGNTMLAAEKKGLLSVDEDRHRRAANSLIETQHPEGYWALEAIGHLGSPATYGNQLGTAMALRVLENSGSKQAEAAIQKSIRWIAQMQPQANIDLAAGVEILKRSDKSDHIKLAKTWTQLLVQQQNKNGSWGPYASRFGEPFDTAIALLAVAPFVSLHSEYRTALNRGRQFLIDTQESTGGWPETTRPSGGNSYAQHISTSAWALEALVQISSVIEDPSN